MEGNIGSSAHAPTLEDILAARTVISRLQGTGELHRTPLIRSRTLAKACEAREVRLKAECLQVTGSYKVRGAIYKVSRLTEAQKRAGVVAASAGNHAQGLAVAAAHAQIRSVIVMPTNAPEAKAHATAHYQWSVEGSRVERFGSSFEDARTRALELVREEGLIFVEAFDDPDIIAGQGTIALEILEEFPDVDTILVGVGGGGLIAGITTALRALKPEVRVIGVEAAGAASMRYALDRGHVEALPLLQNTVADGIKTRIVGELPFAIIRKHLAHDDVVVVGDHAITEAMVLLLERCKLQVEGAGAATVAALLSDSTCDIYAELKAGRRVEDAAFKCCDRLIDVRGHNVVALLSGGNVDETRLASILLAS